MKPNLKKKEIFSNPALIPSTQMKTVSQNRLYATAFFYLETSKGHKGISGVWLLPPTSPLVMTAVNTSNNCVNSTRLPIGWDEDPMTLLINTGTRCSVNSRRQSYHVPFLRRLRTVSREKVFLGFSPSYFGFVNKNPLPF